MDKRKLYLILIIVCAVILTGLIIWAICIKLNNPTGASEPTGTTQSADATENEATDPEETADDATTQPEETTSATEETNPEETTQSTEATENETTDGDKTNSGTKPTTPKEPELPNIYPYTLTWKEYMAMTEDEQIAFYKLFPSHSEYKAWYNAAKKKYDEEKIEIEIGADGTIDLDKILNGDN